MAKKFMPDNLVPIKPKKANGGIDPDSAFVEIIQAATITPENIDWLWEFWLARRKIHIIAGAPGAGKTSVALAFAAAVSCAGCWPDGSVAPLGSVLIWTGEDDLADTLIPRLMVMGADLKRIHFVGRTGSEDGSRAFNPAKDMDLVSNEIKRIGGVSLFIMDPIVSVVSGDSHKNTEVRAGFAPLVDLATVCNCAVLGITHFSKGTQGKDPVERINGSVAFGAIARIGMAAIRQQTEEGGDKRMLIRSKANCAPDTGGYCYDLYFEPITDYPHITAMGVKWGDRVEGTAREILEEAEESNGETRETGKLAVKKWLRQYLTHANHPVASKLVIKEGEEEGYTRRTIYRAWASLQNDLKKEGIDFSKNMGCWGIDEF